MKIWTGFGSEHSYNIVMIGRFKEIADATEAKDAIDQLASQMSDEPESNRESGKYSSEMLALLSKLKVSDLSPEELQQFSYDVRVDQKDALIEISTDEGIVTAFLKLLVGSGAKVEVFSPPE